MCRCGKREKEGEKERDRERLLSNLPGTINCAPKAREREKERGVKLPETSFASKIERSSFFLLFLSVSLYRSLFLYLSSLALPIIGWEAYKDVRRSVKSCARWSSNVSRCLSQRQKVAREHRRNSLFYV